MYSDEDFCDIICSRYIRKFFCAEASVLVAMITLENSC